MAEIDTAKEEKAIARMEREIMTDLGLDDSRKKRKDASDYVGPGILIGGGILLLLLLGKHEGWWGNQPKSYDGSGGVGDYRVASNDQLTDAGGAVVSTDDIIRDAKKHNLSVRLVVTGGAREGFYQLVLKTLHDSGLVVGVKGP